MDSKIIVNPTFTILDWEKAESILNKCTEGTKKHEGCLYYEVIVNNEEGKMTAECREAWACANSLKEHIYGSEGIGGIMGALVEPGVATLDQIYLTGPPQNSQRPRRSLRPLERLDSKYSGLEPGPPILNKCLEGTKEYEGNIYYGFAKRGDSVKCREAWTKASCLKDHIEGERGTGSIMGALVEPGVGTLGPVFVAAPEGELEVVFKVFEAFGVKQYKIHGGFY